jgi:hypothetical protein
MEILSILLGSAWGRLAGTENDGIDKQCFRSLFNPIQMAFVQIPIKNWYDIFIISYYVVWQWGMIQGFSYGLNASLHKLSVFIFKGKGSDGSYKPVEWLTRLFCAMLWCLPSILFISQGSLSRWLIYYITSIVLIPVIGTFINKADWSELLVWGIFSCQVLI